MKWKYLLTKLVFTPAGGGASVEAAAQDPDGAGVQELQVLGEICQSAYTLTMVIENCLESPCELMNEEIEEEVQSISSFLHLLKVLLQIQQEMEI